jgi:hypothetical protein
MVRDLLPCVYVEDNDVGGGDVVVIVGVSVK